MFLLLLPHLMHLNQLAPTGCPPRTYSLRKLLAKYPMWQGKAVLSLVGLQTTESNEVAASGVTDVVSRINSRFSTLTYQDLALLIVADGFCVSSLREL